MRRLLVIALLIFIGLTSVFAYHPAPTQAQRPDAPAYALRGAHPVGVTDVTVEFGDRPLSVSIWYPALNPDGAEELTTYQIAVLQRPGQALRDAAPDIAGGPYPVIYFSHGLGGARLQSIFYTEHLASWGFVVIAADHPGSTFFDVRGGDTSGVIESFGYRPLEILRLIAYSDEINASGPYAGLMDMNSLAVTGHSFGGYTTISAGGAQVNSTSLAAQCSLPEAQEMGLCDNLDERLQTMATVRGLTEVPAELWPATTDPRIKAIVPLAPAAGEIFGEAGMAGVTIPMMLIVGTKDNSTPASTNAIPAFKDASSAEKSLVMLQNADHYIFVDDCIETMVQLGLYNQCSDDVWDMARAHDLINHFATAFFLSHLKGDADAAAALLPEAVDFVGIDYTPAGQTSSPASN